MGQTRDAVRDDGTEGGGAEPRPLVGTAVFILDRCGRFLMLRRRGSHGEGTWSLPGGKQDWAETVSECVCREVEEEVGVALDPDSVRLGPVGNDMFPADGKHFTCVFASAPLPEGAEPRVVEPDKADDIGWFTADALPSPLFASLEGFFALGVAPPFPYRDIAPAARFPGADARP